MEKGKHSIDIEKKTVTFGHETKTLDGKVVLTTTFDFSKVDFKRLLKRAADAELIAWRARSGIKGLSEVEAYEKLSNLTIDCSKEIERTKHVETEDEKAQKAAIKELVGKGISTADILAALNSLKKQSEEQAQAEMEAGEQAAGEEAPAEEDPMQEQA